MADQATKRMLKQRGEIRMLERLAQRLGAERDEMSESLTACQRENTRLALANRELHAEMIGARSAMAQMLSPARRQN
jgi:hypothetical protein